MNPLPFHESAMPAAEAAMAAHEQGKFWPMHDGLFESQASLGRATFERIAQRIGLDMERFRRDLDRHDHRAQIEAQQRAGAALGARGTPSCFVNGKKLRGAQPFERFRVAIDAALEAGRVAMRDNRLRPSQVYDFQAIKRLVPLAAVLERYGVLAKLKRSGTQLVGTCPIHQGTNRKQFVVDPHQNVWRCFGDCDRGGSTIELVSSLEGIEIRQAAALIAEWFAIPGEHGRDVQHKRRRQSMSDTNRPTHKVYSAQKREGQKDFLTRIGSAWPFSTKDNRTGLNIQLSAMPLGERMVLFEADAEEPEAQEPPEKKGNARRK
jgi:hypothetical protein